jgi:hypothetical protein
MRVEHVHPKLSGHIGETRGTTLDPYRSRLPKSTVHPRKHVRKRLWRLGRSVSPFGGGVEARGRELSITHRTSVRMDLPDYAFLPWSNVPYEE